MTTNTSGEAEFAAAVSGTREAHPLYAAVWADVVETLGIEVAIATSEGVKVLRRVKRATAQHDADLIPWTQLERWLGALDADCVVRTRERCIRVDHFLRWEVERMSDDPTLLRTGTDPFESRLLRAVPDDPSASVLVLAFFAYAVSRMEELIARLEEPGPDAVEALFMCTSEICFEHREGGVVPAEPLALEAAQLVAFLSYLDDQLEDVADGDPTAAERIASFLHHLEDGLRITEALREVNV